MIPRCRICGSIMRIQNENGEFVCGRCMIEEIMEWFMRETDDSKANSTEDLSDKTE